MNGESKMKNIVVKIIMWILFWFYLIPYYLVKKVLFKKAAHPILWANCVTIGLFFVLGLVTSPSSHNTSQQSTQKTTLTKKKKEGPKTVTKTITKKVGTKELNKEKAKQNQETNNNGSSSQSQGDLYTANQGTIVGNRNSKIYHVPGQAGYHMHSANAVYFNSEQDAINAGYRKAKR